MILITATFLATFRGIISRNLSGTTRGTSPGQAMALSGNLFQEPSRESFLVTFPGTFSGHLSGDLSIFRLVPRAGEQKLHNRDSTLRYIIYCRFTIKCMFDLYHVDSIVFHFNVLYFHTISSYLLDNWIID